MLLKTEAIVIKTINLREADKIVTFFSRDYGKIQGLARGIRKIRAKQGGKLELFTRVNVIFFQKLASGNVSEQHPLLRITQVDVLEGFPRLKSDFNKIIGASYIAELLNRTFEAYDSTHQAIYPLIDTTFRTIAASDNLRAIVPAFELKLLTHLGYAPLLDRCVKCGRVWNQEPADRQQGAGNEAYKLGFSSVAGGLICRRCRVRQKGYLSVAPESVGILQEMLRLDMRQIPDISLTKISHLEIKTLLTEYIQYHLGISLKTDAFVQKLRSTN